MTILNLVTCRKCLKKKKITSFETRSDVPSGRRRQCRTCNAEYKRKYLEQNPDKAAKWKDISNKRAYHHGSVLKYRYKLTPEQFQEMLKRQDFRCAICKTIEPGRRGWYIDHDHQCCSNNGRFCGKCIRGLLCPECNTGIGNFRDNIVYLTNAIRYINSSWIDLKQAQTYDAPRNT